MGALSASFYLLLAGCVMADKKKRLKIEKTKKLKPAKKQMAVDFDEKGHPLCPGCSSNTKLELVDYDSAPDDKKHLGAYKFVRICKDCNIKVVYYKNI